eukprot:TRINITY_DN7902_c0_g1_i1.p1 TRINITY_DN7902_c0_g1~~TRINITY_DN7902_c0_g1_i1.p1  ORF type:complete len:532 (-),score=116.37 TRINITY_DN7902_c0_g1_i1:34-1629(-)
MATIKDGMLYKYGRQSYKSNKERWFVIQDDGYVYYYKERALATERKKAKGSFHLAGATIRELDGVDDGKFVITAEGSKYTLKPIDGTLMEWLTAFEKAIDKAEADGDLRIGAPTNFERVATAKNEDGKAIWDSSSFQLMNKLGSGAYGEVYRARLVDSPTEFAIKVVDSRRDLSNVKKEIDLLTACVHKNIVQCFGCAFKDQFLWIMMEFCEGGSVLDIMSVLNSPLREAQIGLILHDTLCGLNYLHQHKNMVHRDIKAANILLSGDGLAKIADFGICQSLGSNESGEVLGTPHWIAPEVWREERCTFAADIWSLGITAYELATGSPPYSELGAFSVGWKIARSDSPPPLPECKEKYSEKFKGFINNCLVKDPSNRPSAQLLLQDPLILSCFTERSQLSSLLRKYFKTKKSLEKEMQKMASKRAKHAAKAVSVRDPNMRTSLRRMTIQSQAPPNLQAEEPSFGCTMVVLDNEPSESIQGTMKVRSISGTFGTMRISSDPEAGQASGSSGTGSLTSFQKWFQSQQASESPSE